MHPLQDEEKQKPHDITKWVLVPSGESSHPLEDVAITTVILLQLIPFRSLALCFTFYYLIPIYVAILAYRKQF